MALDDMIREAKQAGTWLAHRRAAAEVRQALGAEQARGAAKVAFLGSFTIDPLVDFVTVDAAEAGIRLETYVGGYGQHNQDILNADSGLYAFEPELVFLFVEFGAAVPGAEGEPAAGAARQAAQALTLLAETFKTRSDAPFVMASFMAPPAWPLHIVPAPLIGQVQEANRLLAEAARDDTQVSVLDLDALAAYHGYREAVSPEMLHMARIPFSEDFMALLARKCMSFVKAHKNLARKCLVLDCDNTLWGGIIGEDGLDGIGLGPDWPGREYVEFQRAVLELFGQGVILAINSKNNRDDVMQVIREHPHMVLREEHFAGMQINWEAKPINMRRLAEEINIGLDSLVFVDDNPVERQMMRDMLPEVAVVDLPENPSLYARTLRETNEFVRLFLTDEDRSRGRIYAEQRHRDELQKTAGSMEDFLRGLQTVVTIRLAEPSDVKRASQLTQRTNQFNLTTRRYSEAEVSAMIESDDWRVHVLGARDKFGDNGTVGLALVAVEGDTWRIDTFLMSCRVIGRQIEDALVDRILTDAARDGAARVVAEYIRTEKNGLVQDFWKRMALTPDDEDGNCSSWHMDLAGYEPKRFSYLTLENV